MRGLPWSVLERLYPRPAVPARPPLPDLFRACRRRAPIQQALSLDPLPGHAVALYLTP